MQKSGAMNGTVVTLSQCGVSAGRNLPQEVSALSALNANDHELASRAHMALQIAGLKGYEYGGEYDPLRSYQGKLYFIPADTLLHEHTQALNIQSEHHLFGGCVTRPFMATKTITHPLIDAAVAIPPGWAAVFADAVKAVVLDGYSAFSRSDAQLAARELLRSGPVRVKAALGIGGSGQMVIHSIAALDAALDSIQPEELATCGVVLEQDLKNVETYSVGQVRVGQLLVTYYGTQRLTENHAKKMVYGGSTLHVVRGGFEKLQQLDLPSAARLAVAQAACYDAAANTHLPGLIASRRNYDVACGTDSRGESRSGVLEQSWRIGGASPAEIAALVTLADDPGVCSVQSSSWEFYGGHAPPAHAHVYFCGDDRRVGQITKYSTVDNYEYSSP